MNNLNVWILYNDNIYELMLWGKDSGERLVGIFCTCGKGKKKERKKVNIIKSTFA